VWRIATELCYERLRGPRLAVPWQRVAHGALRVAVVRAVLVPALVRVLRPVHQWGAVPPRLPGPETTVFTILLGALRNHANAPYKIVLLWKTLRNA
jgi:hypothetical protein